MVNLNYPLLFEPILMERVWGGRRLGTVLGKRLPPGKCIGESWEISDYGVHSTTIANGPLRGGTVGDLMAGDPEALLGAAACRSVERAGDARRFPLLIKWIDAREKLSIQVHPPDSHPRLPPRELGKTECWLIVDAEPEAEIYLGLRRGIDRLALERELARGTADRCLNVFPARPGDFFFVPAGTPHAIGAGVLLAEIQRTSDATFRLWDWNRVDATSGQPRALHIEQALDSIDFGMDTTRTQPRSSTGLQDTELLLGPDQCPHFAVARRSIASARPLGESNRFHVLMCLSGNGQIKGSGPDLTVTRGDCPLLPAGGSFLCYPNPHLELLDVWLP